MRAGMRLGAGWGMHGCRAAAAAPHGASSAHSSQPVHLSLFISACLSHPVATRSVRLAPLLLHLALAEVVLQRVHRQLRHGLLQRLAVVAAIQRQGTEGSWDWVEMQHPAAVQHRMQSGAEGQQPAGGSSKVDAACKAVHAGQSSYRRPARPLRDVEAVKGVAANGVHLRADHVQVDVLEHPHNV